MGDNKGEELAKWEENYWAQMARIMVHGPVRWSKGPKKSKRAQRSLKKEVINPWELWKIQSKQKWAKGTQMKELINEIGKKTNKPQK